MTTASQPLPPKALAFWTRTLRTASNLSQDALAAASGLTTRTVQRIEAGLPSSLTTRRCLARGLRYDDPDIFESPAFVKTVTDLLESLKSAQARDFADAHPDCVKVQVKPVDIGASLTELISVVDGWMYHCDEDIAPEARVHAAVLFDNIQDYGDIWSQLSHSDKIEAESHFSELLLPLRLHAARAYKGTRSVRMIGANWPDKTPLPLTMGYVTVVPAHRDIESLMVPKQGRMA